MTSDAPKAVRCAIYTRVSTDSGLIRSSIPSTRNSRLCRLYQEPEPMLAGSSAARDMMTEGSRADQPIVLPCSGF